MKFIGQYIQRFIARFKSDVYLDDIDSGTIASGGNLGLDSDNKIVKATISSGSGDITAVTITTDSGGGSAASDTGGSADFSILGSSGVGVTNSGTTITAVSVPGEIDHDSLNNFVAAEHYDWASDNSSTATIHTQNINDLHGAGVDGNDDQLLTDGGDGTISSEGNLTYDGYDLTAISSLEGKPVLTLKTTHSTKTKSAELQFLKDAADTEDGENLGLITFYGEDEGNNNTKFGHIKGSIQESDEGQEGGSIKLAVATHDGEIVNGLVINDGSSEDEIDVTIGSTAASVTTVAGTLTMGSTATINNSGVIQVAAQTVIDHDQLANYAANEHFTQANITTVGTIGTGVWQGTAIAHAYIGTDAIETDNIADAQVTVAKLHADAIQTSGESFADNDTSLMTSAAVDDKINTKYSTSYITFSAKSTSSYGTNYVMIHASGISESTFSVNSGVDSAGDFGGVTTEEGGTGTDATISIVSSNLEQQIPIPETCKLMGFFATTSTSTNTGAGYDTGVAIFHVPESEVDWGGSNNSTATLIHKSDSSRHSENTSHSGTNRKKPQKVSRMDGTVKDLAAGDILIPSIFGETSNQQIMATITLVIATPIKTI